MLEIQKKASKEKAERNDHHNDSSSLPKFWGVAIVFSDYVQLARSFIFGGINGKDVETSKHLDFLFFLVAS